MSATYAKRTRLPYDKWYWSDWMADKGLRMCGLSARGLWADMLAIAWDADGYLQVGDKVLGPEEIARFAGASVDEVKVLVAELEANVVFSRDRRGCIYCRRMVRQANLRRKSIENGRLGGNPSLLKEKEKTEPVNPQGIPQSPESRVQRKKKKEDSPPPALPGLSADLISSAPPSDDWPDDYEEIFWSTYPPGRKTDRKKVMAKLATIRKNGNRKGKPVAFGTIVEALMRYGRVAEPQYTKAPIVWLNGDCWDDEYALGPKPPNGDGPSGGGQRKVTFYDVEMGNYPGANR